MKFETHGRIASAVAGNGGIRAPFVKYRLFFDLIERFCGFHQPKSGNETAPVHSMPGIWVWLDSLPKNERPTLLLGDVAYGNEAVLHEAEARAQP